MNYFVKYSLSVKIVIGNNSTVNFGPLEGVVSNRLASTSGKSLSRRKELFLNGLDDSSLGSVLNGHLEASMGSVINVVVILADTEVSHGGEHLVDGHFEVFLKYYSPC